MPGGASANPQIPDRGKAIRISKENGTLEFIAHGLRTPNGIGTGVDDQLFIADNQGDWLPASKIVHLKEGAWFGSRSVDFEGTEGLTETLPVVWLPQDEIGNSPSMPIALNVGPYQHQMIHGEVTHGGIKRVYIEKINHQYQGAVFRFSQGFEAGVNRLTWGPDGSLYVGGVGSSGNWSDGGEQWYGLQRLTYNDKVTFEMLAIRAKSDGLELEFTAPIEAGSGHDPHEYSIQQWYYLHTENYGGPKMDLTTLDIKCIHISEDRKKVFLELPGIKAGHVIHVRIYQPFRSNQQQSLWTTEGWYNMNQVPEGDPGFRSPVSPVKHNSLSAEEISNGWKLLFDGQSTNGWRNFQGEGIGKAWKVENGTLTLDNRHKTEDGIVGGGDIVTGQSYENYELVLDWKRRCTRAGSRAGTFASARPPTSCSANWDLGSRAARAATPVF
jgi:cytochrome c